MLYLRGTTWWLDYEDNGKRYRSSMRTMNRAEAQARADVRLAQREVARAERKARKRLIAAGLAPPESATAWITDRWPRMNFREQQAVIFAMFKGRCAYCSCEVRIPLAREQRSPDRAVLDHKIPVSGGGSNGFENIALSCNACNAKKYDGAAP